MNIQKIYSAKINFVNTTINKRNSYTSDYTSLNFVHVQPLMTDTVSFKAKAGKVVAPEVRAAKARIQARLNRDVKLIAESKTVPTKKDLAGDERTWGVGIATAKQIRSMILKPQEQINDFMNRIFGDLRTSEIAPKNPILDISGRAKSEVSIMEKSATRKWNSKKEILDNMTDLNGAKIVFNYKTGKPEAEISLDRLIPLIKTKQVTLKEIELQRPGDIKGMSKKEQEEFDYFSKAFLDKLEDAQEEVLNGLEENVDKIKLIDRPLPKYTKGNYCALHLLLEINEKGSRPFELQIMGAREAKGKYFDDKRFKDFDGKELDKMYRPLVELWKPLKTEENKAAKEEFLRYCRDANLQLRKDEIHEYKTQKLLNRATGFFKSVRGYNLPPEYDLNEQYKIMINCEKKHKKNSKQETATVPDLTKLVKRYVSKSKLKAQLEEKFGSKKAKDRNSYRQKL